METILRSKEMAEIKLLPVRHHSPACAVHIKSTIEQYQPEIVLIEGPENANALLPVIADAETKAPFAIYYSYHDKTGCISEEKEHYKCYYPYLDYSPELVAVREGTRRGMTVAFIDLSYGDILAASAAVKSRLNYNDDYLITQSEYAKLLCEKAQLRNFDEFWEKYFEINGLDMESEAWFDNLLAYCGLIRENTPEESLRKEGCLAREQKMADNILTYAKSAGKNKKILVVTGGFHTPALKEQIALKIKQNGISENSRVSGQVPTKDQSVYLMPYSMEAADSLNGYASGMPFPGFYQKIWESFREGTPYQKTVLDFIVASGRETRKEEGYLSTFDEICACQMTEGLAQLRGKREPGTYELFDAVLSSYIKGEYTIATDTPVRILKRLMTGNTLGELCGHAAVPPIVQDFNEKCKNFGLKNTSTLENEVTLSIFSSKKHRQMSMFFNRVDFLHTNYARKVKGPNLQLRKDKNLMREIWRYKWNIQVQAALIDVSVHGATIEEAIVSIIKDMLKKDMNAGKCAILLTQIFEMGLENQLEEVYIRICSLMQTDSDFYSLADALTSIRMMCDMAELYHSRLDFKELLHVGVRRLIILLPSMTRIKEDSLKACMEALKLLYQIVTEYVTDNFDVEREEYIAALFKMQEDSQIQPGLNGCVNGILYGSKNRSEREVEQACYGYLKGTREQMLMTAQFFHGLFCTARDLLFIDKAFMKLLDGFFGEVQEMEFMELLPELRMAFAYFTPREIDKIASIVAKMHDTDIEDVLERDEVLPMWSAYGKELDAYAVKYMQKEM